MTPTRFNRSSATVSQGKIKLKQETGFLPHKVQKGHWWVFHAQFIQQSAKIRAQSTHCWSLGRLLFTALSPGCTEVRLYFSNTIHAPKSTDQKLRGGEKGRKTFHFCPYFSSMDDPLTQKWIECGEMTGSCHVEEKKKGKRRAALCKQKRVSSTRVLLPASPEGQRRVN